MVRELLGAKLKSVRGSLRSENGERHRAPLFTVLSVVFCVMLFRSSLWLVNEALDIPPVGELLVQKLVSIAFLVFLGLLVFSNLVAAFTTFYLADDMDFLLAHPIPTDDLFHSRYLEALSQSSWVILLFGMPPFTALGVAMQAPWTYYAALVGVFVPFLAIPTGLATIVTLGIANMMITTRMRDLMVFVGMLGFVGLFYGIRVFKPEKLLNPDSFDSIGEMISLLSTPRASYLPSDWAVNVLSPLLFSQRDFDWWSLGMLVTTPLMLFFVATWLHRRAFHRGYSRVQEGRHGDSVLLAIRDWLLRRSTERGGGVQARLDALLERAGERFGPMAQLTRKDRLIFTRDASQWSNILIIVALVIIYLANYQYFEIATGANFVGEVGIYYFNLAVCGFVVVALAGRFLFPAVSIEGRSFWLMMQAPISLEQMLVGKWLGAMGPVVFVGLFMGLASNLLVDTPWFLTLLGVVVVLQHSVCVAGVAVGMGAIYPQFHNPNASAIAASFGAIIYMISSILLILTSLFFSYLWIARLRRVVGGTEEFVFVAKEAIGLVIALALPLLAAYLAIKLGARALRKRL